MFSSNKECQHTVTGDSIFSLELYENTNSELKVAARLLLSLNPEMDLNINPKSWISI